MPPLEADQCQQVYQKGSWRSEERVEMRGGGKAKKGVRERENYWLWPIRTTLVTVWSSSTALICSYATLTSAVS